eukprot:13617079-Heterocapsa_arctica.AAC.1
MKRFMFTYVYTPPPFSLYSKDRTQAKGLGRRLHARKAPHSTPGAAGAFPTFPRGRWPRPAA